MEFWAGELNKSCIKEIKHTKVMDSAVNFIPKAMSVDLKDFVVPDVRYHYEQMFLDNGAFSLLKSSDRSNSNKKIKRFERFVLKTQQSIKPKFTVPFDYPFIPGMSVNKMTKEWKKTRSNIEVWESECAHVENLVPALHAWNMNSLKENIRWIYRQDYDKMAVGSTITLDVDLKGFFGDRQPTKNLFESFMIINRIADEYGIKVHVFGLGSSPMMYHLANYCGIDSSDSAGYRRKAAYGKIILPQTSERYAGNGTARFGVNRKKGLGFSNIFSEEEKDKLKHCGCPACSQVGTHSYNRWLHLKSDWKLRAIHNKWVMDQEVKIAERFNEGPRGEYVKFLDKNCARSRTFNYLWRYIKKREKKLKIKIRCS